MDAKQIGAIIASLRKSKGFTQATLAKRLNVSDKTISKWESGLGFPEITQFPTIASLFGVSIDYLMTGERTGIAIAGNLIVDSVKEISSYPAMGKLVRINNISRAVGGCTPNVAIDLIKMDPALSVSAIGCVGDDDNGYFIKGELSKYGVNTDMVTVLEKTVTGSTDVMSIPGGERTFFTFKGADGLFSPQHVNIPAIKAKMLHIGYILLLDSFDAPDKEYGTVMARFLNEVQQAGIKTSIDVVSDANADFGAAIIPSLKYSDYVIINETECCAIWDVEPRNEDGSLNVNNLRIAMEKTMQAGVREKVIVHAKEAGFCLSSNGSFTQMASLKLDKNLIKGSVGAGDAFCAGSLYGIYNDFSDTEILEYASAAAACSLFEEDAISGMRTRSEVMQIKDSFGRINL